MKTRDKLETEDKLRIQYALTAVVTLFVGILILVAPDILAVNQDPLLFGALGCIWITFGILSILGLKQPLNLVPVLIFQLIYKVVRNLPVFSAGAFHPMIYTTLLPLHIGLSRYIKLIFFKTGKNPERHTTAYAKLF